MTDKLTIAQQLNDTVASVLGQHNIMGFERAYMIADATTKLQTLLTPEYMKPIMALQGSKLGFQVDKIYPETVVKNCLIEAVLTGLQPHGNQFNIIAGNMYPTKEGIGYLLSNYKGLKYQIIPELPRINATNTSAAIKMNITWSIFNGTQKEESIEIPIKMDKWTGTDAIIGKATRKARAWLYSTITGNEITDGEVEDLDSPAYVQQSQSQDPKKVSDEKEYRRIEKHIEESDSIKKLEQVEQAVIKMKDEGLTSLYEGKKHELVFGD